MPAEVLTEPQISATQAEQQQDYSSTVHDIDTITAKQPTTV